MSTFSEVKLSDFLTQTVVVAQTWNISQGEGPGAASRGRPHLHRRQLRGRRTEGLQRQD